MKYMRSSSIIVALLLGATVANANLMQKPVFKSGNVCPSQDYCVFIKGDNSLTEVVQGKTYARVNYQGASVQVELPFSLGKSDTFFWSLNPESEKVKGILKAKIGVSRIGDQNFDDCYFSASAPIKSEKHTLLISKTGDTYTCSKI